MAGLSEERTTFRYDDRGNPVEQTKEDNRREISVYATGVALGQAVGHAVNSPFNNTLTGHFAAVLFLEVGQTSC